VALFIHSKKQTQIDAAFVHTDGVVDLTADDDEADIGSGPPDLEPMLQGTGDRAGAHHLSFDHSEASDDRPEVDETEVTSDVEQIMYEPRTTATRVPPRREWSSESAWNEEDQLVSFERDKEAFKARGECVFAYSREIAQRRENALRSNRWCVLGRIV
jgi:hypothetical protein